MIVVRGKKTAEIGRDELRSLIEPYREVVIDVGTGDGRFVAAYAREHPDRFVIGLDPVRENMREQSGRLQRKRTRLDNALYVMASIEQLPAELDGLGSRIFVNLPWGSLMRGLILGDDEVLSGLAWIAIPGAAIRVVLNTRIFSDPVPVEAQDLPELTEAHIRDVLAPVYLRHGLRITAGHELDPDELLDLPTSWAKRLSHRQPPPSMVIEAVREPTLTDHDSG